MGGGQANGTEAADSREMAATSSEGDGLEDEAEPTLTDLADTAGVAASSTVLEEDVLEFERLASSFSSRSFSSFS